MLELIKFQAENWGANTHYEKTRANPTLITACENILKAVEEYNIPYNVRPLVWKQYKQYVEKYHAAYGTGKLPDVEKWINDPHCKPGMDRVMREIRIIDCPEHVRKEALEAFKTQEDVYEDLFLFRVVKQIPGDNTTLHFDPKPFYSPHRDWIPGDYTDMNAQIFMHDRKPGQVSYMGGSSLNYKQYDMYKYETTKVYHGAANMGWEDRIMVYFSWAKPNNA